MLQHLLREDAIKLHLEAPNREAALAELVAMLPAWALNSKQKASILEYVLQRESLGTTIIGEGVALPNCIFPGISGPLAVIGISKNGIPYTAVDGGRVHVLILVVFPDNADCHYERYRVVKDAEMLFSDPFLRERIKICEAPEEVYEIILRESNSFGQDFRRGNFRAAH